MGVKFQHRVWLSACFPSKSGIFRDEMRGKLPLVGCESMKLSSGFSFPLPLIMDYIYSLIPIVGDRTSQWERDCCSNMIVCFVSVCDELLVKIIFVLFWIAVYRKSLLSDTDFFVEVL